MFASAHVLCEIVSTGGVNTTDVALKHLTFSIAVSLNVNLRPFMNHHMLFVLVLGVKHSTTSVYPACVAAVPGSLLVYISKFTT